MPVILIANRAAREIRDAGNPVVVGAGCRNVGDVIGSAQGIHDGLEALLRIVMEPHHVAIAVHDATDPRHRIDVVARVGTERQRAEFPETLIGKSEPEGEVVGILPQLVGQPILHPNDISIASARIDSLLAGPIVAHPEDQIAAAIARMQVEIQLRACTPRDVDVVGKVPAATHRVTNIFDILPLSSMGAGIVMGPVGAHPIEVRAHALDLEVGFLVNEFARIVIHGVGGALGV